MYFKDKAGPYKFQYSIQQLELASQLSEAPAANPTLTVALPTPPRAAATTPAPNVATPVQITSVCTEDLTERKAAEGVAHLNDTNDTRIASQRSDVWDPNVSEATYVP